MGFATAGNSDGWPTDDLGTTIRHPISVAALLEREGFEPVRRRAARRALSGVAAGAVLTLGAVVGSLFLNHGRTTTGDTLAAGGFVKSGGDVILAETSPSGTSPAPHAQPGVVASPHQAAPGQTHPAGHAPVGTTSATVQRPVATPHKSDRSVTTGDSGGSPVAGAASVAPATTSSSTGSPGSSTQSAPSSTQSAPTGTSTPPTSSTTTTGTPSTGTPSTSTTPPSSTTTPPTSTTPPTTTQGGALLGGVGDILGDVTQPVFNWFG